MNNKQQVNRMMCWKVIRATHKNRAGKGARKCCGGEVCNFKQRAQIGITKKVILNYLSKAMKEKVLAMCVAGGEESSRGNCEAGEDLTKSRQRSQCDQDEVSKRERSRCALRELLRGKKIDCCEIWGFTINKMGHRCRNLREGVVSMDLHFQSICPQF